MVRRALRGNLLSAVVFTAMVLTPVSGASAAEKKGHCSSSKGSKTTLQVHNRSASQLAIYRQTGNCGSKLVGLMLPNISSKLQARTGESWTLRSAEFGAVVQTVAIKRKNQPVIVRDLDLPCTIVAPPKARFDEFYKKYCLASGVPVISSQLVPDAALMRAAAVVNRMLIGLPSVRDAIVRNGTHLAILAESEVTTDLPEYRYIYDLFPGVDWNTRARGLGATPNIPLTFGVEENVLCYSSDPHAGESTLLHEWAHTVKIMGVEYIDPTFHERVEQAYVDALSTGLWAGTYALTNSEEYWAEGVQSYFNSNIESVPPDGVHNSVDTKAELKSYDPTLYELINGIFAKSEPIQECP